MINEINNISIDAQYMLVSFDVVSLFTKILVNYTINIITNISNEEIATWLNCALAQHISIFEERYLNRLKG
jgi:hypothetical protein